MTLRSLRVAALFISLSIPTTLFAQHNLSVDKTGPASSAADFDVTYGITVANAGAQVDAPTVTLTDTLPGNLIFVSLSQDSGPTFSCTSPTPGSGGTVNCTIALLAPNASATFTLKAHIPAGTPPGTSYDNTANVTAGGVDSNPGDNSDTVNTLVLATTDFGVLKTGPGTATADTDISWNVQVTNFGPDAGDVTLTDTMPPGLTFVSTTQNSGPSFSCSDPGAGNNGPIVCSATGVLSGQTADFTFVMHVPAGTPDGTEFTNNASAASATDLNEENDNASDTVFISPNAADVGVQKDGPGAAAPDTDVTYTITVVNNGPNDADTVQWTDTLPGTMTFVSLTQDNGPVFNCTTGATVTCSIDPLPVFSSATFTLVGHIPAGTAVGTSFHNTVTVTSQNDPFSENDIASTTLVVSSANLAIVKTGPGTATAGQTITYTIGLTNNGPDIATNVLLHDSLPNGTTFQSLTQNTGPTFTCLTPTAGNPGDVDCSITTFNNAAQANFTLVLNIEPTFADATTLSNTATTSSESADPNLNDNSSTTNATVTGVTDVSITKSGPATVNAGSNITYTITITNLGANAAANTSWTDTLPPTTTYVSLTQNSGPTFNCSGTSTVTCTNASFPSGATATFTLVASTPGSGTGSLSNTANVSTTTIDFNSSNDMSTANTNYATSADLSVTKTGPPTAVQNQQVSYQITVTNNGPSDAQNVTMTDNVPPQATFDSFSQNAGPTFNCTTGATVTCTIATFPAGSQAIFTLTVMTNASVSGGMLNTANVSSSTPDPNNANNSASAATNIVTADIAVTKSGPATVGAGSNITWTIVVTNNGPADAINVTLNDALPANTTFVSIGQAGGPTWGCATPPVGTNGTVTCLATSFVNGASTTFTLVAQTAPNTPAGTLSNTAVVAPQSPLDPTPGNNTAISNTTVVLADVAVTKNGAPATVAAGSNITWTIVVTNNGPADATNVTLHDALPANTTFVSLGQTGAPWSCTTPAVGSNGAVDCLAATLTNGASTTFTLVAKTASTTPPGTISNTATVQAQSPLDPTPGNNTTISNTNVALVDLSLTKSLSPGPYLAGMPVTFTLLVTNSGTVPAENVVVTDVLPFGMSATSTTPLGACTGTTTVICTAATLGAGASTTFTITANLPGAVGNYTNSATVTSANGDAAPTNNTGSAGFAVIPGAAIPMLDPAVLALLAVLLGIAAVLAMKR